MKRIHNHSHSLLYSNPRQTLHLEYQFYVTRLIRYLHEPKRRPSSDFRGVPPEMHFFLQIIHLGNARQMDWRLLDSYQLLLLSLTLTLLSELPALPPHILRHRSVLTICQHFTHFPARALFDAQLSGVLFLIEKP